MISLSKFIHNIRVKRAKLNLYLMHCPISRWTIAPSSYRVISNQLSTTFPSEYAPDLIIRSNIVTLKCTARDVPIKDIPQAWCSNDFSYEELQELHSFGWISLLDMDMDRQWLRMIRKHLNFWMVHFRKPDALAWSVTAERVYNWIVRYNLISKTSDTAFIKKFTSSLLYQMEYLHKLLYLPQNVIEKVGLIRTLMVAYAAVGKVSVVKNALSELCNYINSTDCINEVRSTYDLVKLLRYLIDIDGMTYVCKHGTPQEVLNLMAKLSGVIKKLMHADGGISVFGSAFTPAPTYLDSLLSSVKRTISANDNDGYLRFSALDGTLFMSLRDKQLSTEFTFNGQRIILGTYFNFSGGNFSHWSDVGYSTHNETSNIWFTGQSKFVVSDHDVTFFKKMYMDSFGTDLRCEEKFSTQSFSISRYIVLPGDVDISPLEYQNGFFLTLPNGERWIWNFSNNAEFSLDNRNCAIINGRRISLILLTISVNSDEDNTLLWSLKKNITKL